MVKGVSRRVIVVRSPDQRFFEQAIFLLRDGAGEVSDEALLREAKGCLEAPGRGSRNRPACGPLWAVAGAGVMGLMWFVTVLF